MARTADFSAIEKVRKGSSNEAAEAIGGFGRPFKERNGGTGYFPALTIEYVFTPLRSSKRRRLVFPFCSDKAF